MTTAVRGLSPEQMDQYNSDGYLIISGLFSKQEIDQMRDSFMDLAVDGPVPGLSDIHGTVDRSDPLSFYPRMMNPHTHPDTTAGHLARTYLTHSRLYPILEALLGSEPAAAQSMFYFKPPKARGQELHQDNFYLRVKPGTCLAAWIAIDDVDSENGGMKIVKGSQKLDISCPEKADLSTSFTIDYVPVPVGMTAEHADMKAGDVLFFNGSVIHGSTPNTSLDRFRRSLIFHYVPKSTTEMSNYNVISFDGDPLSIALAEGGGPCGTSQPVGLH